MAWIWVMLGGALGSLGRYFISKAIPPNAFPWSTLLVNIAGSFLIGLFSGWYTKGSISQSAQMFLVTGLMGGFTTFSAFSMENLYLIKEGSWIQALIYISVSVVASLLMCALGIRITSQF